MNQSNVKSKLTLLLLSLKDHSKLNQKEIMSQILDLAKKSSPDFSLTEVTISRIKNHPTYCPKPDKSKIIIETIEQILDRDYPDFDYKAQYKDLEKANSINLPFEFHEKLDTTELNKTILSEQNEIRILESWFNDAYGFKIIKALAKKAENLELIENNNNNKPIKILLLNPNGDINIIRSLGLNEAPEDGKNKIISDLKSIHNFESLREKVEVRLYDHLPGSPSYIFSSVMFIGWQYLERPSSFGTFLSIKKENDDHRFVTQRVEEHFEKLWKKSEKVNLNNSEAFKKSIANIEQGFETRIRNREHDIREIANRYIVPSSDKRKLKNLIGHWKLLFLRQIPVDKNFGMENPQISEIGHNHIRIYEEGDTSNNKVLVCEMSYRHSKNSEYTEEDTSKSLRSYKGVVNLALKNDSYLDCLLFSKDHKRCLHLIFDIDHGFSDGILFGSYITLYEKRLGIGGGNAVLIKSQKIDPEDINQLDLRSYNPLMQRDLIPVIDKRIINYLLFRKNSLLKPIQNIDHLEENFKDNKFTGKIAVYTYSKDIEKKTCVSIERLYISPSSYAIYQRNDYRNRGDYRGSAEKKGDNLQIRLFNKKQENDCLINIYVEYSTPKIDKLYSGTISRISPRGKKPIALLALFQFKDLNFDLTTTKKQDDIEIRKIKVHSKDYQSSEVIPTPIAKSITGRQNNFLGWRKNIFTPKDLEEVFESNIDYGELFYESAMFNIEKQPPKTLQMIRRALAHGFIDKKRILNFEKDIEGTVTQEKILLDEEYQFLRELILGERQIIDQEKEEK